MRFVNFAMLFIVYSLIGSIGETIICYFDFKKIVHRGFMIGPFCPIYGFGGLISYFISLYVKNIFLFFLISILIISVLEYFTSFIMEKLFNARWWDYSKEKYNLNGRICLSKIFQFGILSVISVYLVNPILIINIYKIPDYVSYFIISLFLIDFVLCFLIVSRFKIKKLNEKDSTEEISEMVKDSILEKD